MSDSHCIPAAQERGDFKEHAVEKQCDDYEEREFL